MVILTARDFELSRAGAAGLHQELTDLRSLASNVVERAAPIGHERAISVELAPGPADDVADEKDAHDHKLTAIGAGG